MRISDWSSDVCSSDLNPGGELDGPYRRLQIRTRWKTDDNMMFGELADEYIRLYGSVGRVEWFIDDWKTWVETVRDSVFVDFGDAAGSAQFLDRVIVTAPDLITPEARFVLAPQDARERVGECKREEV